MFKISNETMDTFHEEGLKKLEQKILKHWFEDLKASGELAGPEGRAEVVENVKVVSRDDPELTEGELIMLADLMLVFVAKEGLASSGKKEVSEDFFDVEGNLRDVSDTIWFAQSGYELEAAICLMLEEPNIGAVVRGEVPVIRKSGSDLGAGMLSSALELDVDAMLQKYATHPTLSKYF